MNGGTTTWLEWYQPYRRYVEIGFWVVVMLLQIVFNSIVAWIDLGRGAHGVAYWQPLTWEVSSNIAVGMLIPAIVAFEARYPLRFNTLPRNLWPHLGASVAFSLIHVVMMHGLRYPIYAAMGEQYRHAGWLVTFFYEYLKDVRSYALILAAVLSYRLILLRLQGEATMLDEPEPPEGKAPPPTVRPERFLVRKLRKEFLIAAGEIEWLQAQGNYVGLHVNGHDYLLRATLTDFLEQLDPARFTRVHRSYAVNLDRVKVIVPLDGGDARLHMKDGSEVPCSRRYRDALAPTPA